MNLKLIEPFGNYLRMREKGGRELSIDEELIKRHPSGTGIGVRYSEKLIGRNLSFTKC
jgi:GMP synthase PP-ATPase subunit